MQESKLVQIPIKEYEEDMKTEKAKEKKSKILDLFSNSNNLHSKDEFKEIQQKMHNACIDGDLELIKIYLCETIENESKSLKFKIDRTTQTASLFNSSDDIKDLIIPRVIRHESTDFLVTSISSVCGKIETIRFAEDSAVKTVYGQAFPLLSRIKEIYFPASLKELKEGWCEKIERLTKIVISPSNDQFVLKDDKCLLGKSDTSNDEFDILLFASRDIEEASIPPNIKVISPFAFSYCHKLRKVEIPQNSNLRTIGESAFSYSSIKEIFIPPNVSKICLNTFLFCKNLTKVEIPQNSNLQIIGKNAFSASNIKEIFIPAKVSKICENAFSFCHNLTKVEIPHNSNLQTIESFAFESSHIKEIFIPPQISKICKNTFNFCKNLTKVEIPQNSNLQTIESLGFASSNIKEIFIPPKVTVICKSAFSSCRNLTKVEIPQNSSLQIIGEDAFFESSIKDIFIPPKVSTIGEDAFSFCRNLQIIEISEDSELESLSPEAFSQYGRYIIMSPSKNITKKLFR